jgi:hypothetical protein
MDAKEVGKCPHFADANVQVRSAAYFLNHSRYSGHHNISSYISFVQQKNQRINVPSDHETSRKLQKIKRGHTN